MELEGTILLYRSTSAQPLRYIERPLSQDEVLLMPCDRTFVKGSKGPFLADCRWMSTCEPGPPDSRQMR
jgi:hypothetical protein